MKKAKQIYFISLLLVVPFMYLVAYSICIPVRIYRFIQDPVGVYAMTEINVPHYAKKTDSKKEAREWMLKQWEAVGQRENAEKIIACESNFDNNKYNINTNKTVDLGYYMWNSIHLKSGLITLDCISDYRCSTNKAIEMYNKSGWKPWACAKLVDLK